jgi:CMP-N,N'-diacetyllegionaminic acid synthase
LGRADSRIERYRGNRRRRLRCHCHAAADLTLRKAEHVRGCLEKLVNEGLDAVWTVSETDPKNHPLKQLTLGTHGELGYYDPEAAGIIARQQLKPVYHRNGIAYAISRECLVNQKTILGRKTAGIVVPGVHVSIDTPWDMALVEFILTSEKQEDRGPFGASST